MSNPALKIAIRNERGVTLMELVVAIGISLIVMVPALAVMTSMISMEMNARNMVGTSDFRANLVLMLKNPNICYGILMNASNPTVFNPTQASLITGMPLNITLDNGATVITSPDPATIVTSNPILLTNYHIYYDYITFNVTSAPTADPNNPGNLLYIGSVIVKTDRIQVSNVGASSITDQPAQVIASIGLSVNGANVITGCTGVQKITDACSVIGGVITGGVCVTTVPCQLYDAGGCVTPVTSCPANQGLAFDNTGALICQNL